MVDEVLAVGDIAFQKKCLGKMGEVSKEGRTILFVSHNMGAVAELCPRSRAARRASATMRSSLLESITTLRASLAGVSWLAG